MEWKKIEDALIEKIESILGLRKKELPTRIDDEYFDYICNKIMKGGEKQ
jgi:hypothetical protein